MTYAHLPFVVVYLIIGIAVATLARRSSSWQDLTIAYAWSADVIIVTVWPLIIMASVMVMIVRALKT